MQPSLKKSKNGKFKNTSFVWLAIILLFGIIYISYANVVMSDITEAFLADLIRGSAKAFSRNIQTKILYVEALAAMDVMTDDNVPFENKLNGLDSIIEEADLTRLLLIDPEKNGISSYGEHVTIDEREYFIKAMKGESSMTTPLASVFGEQWVTVIAVPVINADSEIVAVLAGGIDANGFISLYQNVNNSYKTKFHILGHNYNYALEFTVSEDNQEINFQSGFAFDDEGGESSVIASLIKDNGFEDGFGFAEYIYKGVPRYLVYEDVKGTDFILAASIEKSAVFKRIRNTVTLNNSVTLFILMLLSAVVYYNMELNAALKAQQEKTNLAIDVTKLLIMEVERKSNKIKSVNENTLLLLGFKENELINKSPFDLISEAERNNYTWANVDRLVEKSSPPLEIPIIRKDGGVLHIMWRIATTSEGVYEFIGADVTPLKKSQEQINRLAYYDHLTGLYNRISLENHINESIRDGKSSFAFIHIDMDNFKYVNDTFDHYFGNKIIMEMAERILKVSKDDKNINAKVFRISGDEFAIIYHSFSNYSEVGDYCNKVYNEIYQDFCVDDIKISVTVSMGISIFPDYAADLPEIFKTAEIAMINAKTLGKSRIIFFNDEMKRELEKTVYITNDLKEALDKKEFVLYYQPQYDIRSGALYGYEALMRWVSPKKGLLQPSDFIPYAERNHLISKMGIWALEEAARFSNQIKKLGYHNLKISVNVSVVQLLDEGFVEDILKVFEKTNASVENIYLEITESVMMESIDKSLIKLKQLNAVGINFSLDDFGTGYSSLTYLKRLPVDTLKIDKSFIDSILEEDNANQQIVMAIINLARTLGLTVVAEGVEERVQLDWLRDRGCDICQGFITGRPLPRAEAIQLLGR